MTRRRTLPDLRPSFETAVRADPRRARARVTTVRSALAMLVVSLTACLVAATAADAAVKNVVGSIGSPGTSGGLFGAGSPRGSAVNQATNDLYAVDGASSRVEQFNSSGAFIRAWGQDVVAAGKPNNARAIQTVAVSASGGTFTLSYAGQTTAALAFDAQAASVESALNALSTIGGAGGSVTVVGGPGSANGSNPYVVTFGGALAGIAVSTMTSSTTLLTGSPKTAVVAAPSPGGTGFEICDTTNGNVAADCKAGIATGATGNGGDLSAGSQGIAVDQSTGDVYVTDQTKFRLQKFDSSGHFKWAAGADVVVGGVTTFETCQIAINCKNGAAGATGGQFGTALGNAAVDPISGAVYVADSTNKRVQSFSPAGAFTSAFGYDVDSTLAGTGYEICTALSGDTCKIGVANTPASASAPLGQFGASGPTRVAVNSSGEIFVVDPSNWRVQMFNPATTTSETFAAGSVSGNNTANGPSDVVVDPTNDDLYVVKAVASPTGRQVLQFDASGTLVETHGVGAGLPAVNSVSVGHANGNIYLATSTGSQVLVLNAPAIPPIVTLDQVSGVTADSATFGGTVNPTGFATTYHFEYSVDGTTWQRVPAANLAAGAGSVPVSAVPQTATGLLANTTYQYRLVANKTYSPDAVASSPQTFTTAKAAPEVSKTSTGHLEPASTSVVVRASIDPKYAPTRYRFEYGPSSAYGARTPAEDAAVPGGGSGTVVVQTIEGLEPGVRYHVRAVATNESGQSEGEELSFTIPLARPSGGRQYELVSPSDGEPYDVAAEPYAMSTSQYAARQRSSAPDGSGLVFDLTVNGTLPGMISDGDAVDPMIATRRQDGWHAWAPIGDKTTFDVIPHDLAEDASGLVFDLTRAADTAAVGPWDPTTSEPYVRKGIGTPANTLYGVRSSEAGATLLAAKTGPSGALEVRTGTDSDRYLGGSPDLSTVYFVARALVPDASSDGLYRRTDEGVTLLNRRYDGTPLTTIRSDTDRPNTVSADGSTITITAAGSSIPTSDGNMVQADNDAVDDVYQVIGDQVIWVSQSEYSGSAQASRARSFQGASASGRRVLFSSQERLVGNGLDAGDLDSATDLYMFERDADVGHRLTLVSISDPSCDAVPPPVTACDDNASNTGPSNTSGAKPVGLSDDGTHVFFITGDVLNPADDDGMQSLYVRDIVDSTTTYIAPAGSGATSGTDGDDAGTDISGSLVASVNPTDTRRRPFRSSNDGTVAAFVLASNVTLPAGRGGDDQDGVRDLYVWTERDGLRRVRQGSTPDANTGTVPSLGCILSDGNVPLTCRGMSASGSDVYFQTTDPLADADINSTLDVYGEASATGDVTLISGGDTETDSVYFDNDESGGNVFFFTGETLDPSRDTDGGHFDLYDARVGGGLPPLLPRVSCDPIREQCQSPPAEQPAISAPGTSDDIGPVRVVVPSFRVAAVSATQRRRLAESGRLTLSVTSSDSGTIQVQAVAQVGKRSVIAASARKSVARAGVTSLTLTLSKASRAELKRTRKLTLRVAVNHSKVAVTQNTMIRLTTPKSKAKKVIRKKSKHAARATGKRHVTVRVTARGVS